MDRHSLVLLIPIMALSIPVLGLLFAGFQRYAKLRLEETRLRLEGGPGRSSSRCAARWTTSVANWVKCTNGSISPSASWPAPRSATVGSTPCGRSRADRG